MGRIQKITDALIVHLTTVQKFLEYWNNSRPTFLFKSYITCAPLFPLKKSCNFSFKIL